MKNIFVVLLVLFAVACKKAGTATVEKYHTEALPATVTTGDQYLLCAEQSQNRIAVIDITNSTFFWTWKAAVNNNIPTADAGWYDLPSEAKRVYNGLYILMTASDGGVALIRQSSKKAVFFARGIGNMHSAELLPDGNIAAVSSDSNYLMIFRMDTTSLPGTITWKKRFPDTAPHNVVWDRTRSRLWAAGAHKLYAFSYNNDCHSPSLTATDSFTLPAANAHDLFPVYGSTDSLWLTTGGKVWKFSAATHSFTSAIATITGVKSISSGPAGYPTVYLQSISDTQWWNDEVQNLANGLPVFQMTGLEIYKARWKISDDNTFSYPTGDTLKVCH
jgi:hypothetical protein